MKQLPVMRRLALTLACVLATVPATAQRVSGDRGPQEATPIRCVNTAGTAFESCAGGGGATDADDGSVAGAQTAGLSIGLTYVWGGAAWQRMVAAALTDNTANPTVPSFGAFAHIWDGATWDRWTGAVTALGSKTNNNAAPGATNVGTLPCIATAANPSSTEGNQVGCSQDLTGRSRVMNPDVSETDSLNTTIDESTVEFELNGIGGITFTITGAWQDADAELKFEARRPDGTWNFLAAFNMDNGAGILLNDFQTGTGAGTSAINGTWIATGTTGFDRLRVRTNVPGAASATVTWRGTQRGEYAFTQTFGDLRQNDPAMQTGVALSATNLAVWPLMIGGHGFSAAAFPQPALATLPNPITGNNRRATLAMSPYGEARVMASDHHLICTIDAVEICGNGTAILPTEGAQGLSIQIRGTWVGSIAFEHSYDGTNWTTAIGFNNETYTGAFECLSSAPCTVNGTWVLVFSNGAAYIRARSTAWTSGAATVTYRGHNAPPIQLALNFGDKSHGGADSSTAPIKTGAKAHTGIPTAVADATRVNNIADVYGAQFVRDDHPNRIRCTVTVSTATTIQAVGGSCVAPGAGLSLYVTDVMFSASAAGIAADAFPTLKYGTGGTCGTGTTVFWGALTATAIRTSDSFQTAIKIPANNEICWITTTAGSKFIVISGFIAP